MSTKKTDIIANQDLAPPVFNDPGLSFAHLLSSIGRVAVAITDIELNDIIVLEQFPASARILDILILNDDLDSAGPTLTYKLGVYDEDDVALDDDIYGATKTDLQAAVTDWTSIDGRGIELVGQRLWEDAGIASAPDPGTEFRIAMDIDAAAATAVAGDIAVRFIYVHD